VDTVNAIGRCAGVALLLWAFLVTAAPGGDDGAWVLWTKIGGVTTTPVPWTALGKSRTREDCIAAMRTQLEDRATLFEDTHQGVVIAIVRTAHRRSDGASPTPLATRTR
jgi:hypothetical protein